MVMQSYFETHAKPQGRRRKKRMGNVDDPKEGRSEYRDDYGL